MELLFTKILSETDVKRRLAIPPYALQRLPSESRNRGATVELLVQDNSGRFWIFDLYVRREGHPKPVLTKGWMDFARSRGLRAGDKVSFYHLRGYTTGAPFRIDVQRAGQEYRVIDPQFIRNDTDPKILPASDGGQESFRHNKEKIVTKDENDQDSEGTIVTEDENDQDSEDENDQDSEDEFPWSVERDTNASSVQGRTVLEEIPEGEEWHAKEIFVTGCKPVLPESPHCPFLLVLSLSGCKALRTLPSSFFEHMYVLEHLNLSHTSIRSLPVSLFKLDLLKHLILRCCKLFMKLSPQIGQLHNLQELDLDDTQIVGLPSEIGMLSKLKILKISLDGYMNCEKESQQNLLIHPGTIKSLFRLIELQIDVNPDCEGWNEVVEDVVEEVCTLGRLQSLTLYFPHVQILRKCNIGGTYMSFYPLSRFCFTVGQHRQRNFCEVPKNVEAHFQKWDKCLKFVNGNDISSEMKRAVGCTTAFYLERHASARSLCNFGIENMKNLQFCLLLECYEIQTIIDGGKAYEEEQTDMVKGEATSCGSYFTQEPALLNLQFLHIYYLDNLKSIWSTPVFGQQCLSALKVLELHACPKLEVILSPVMLINHGKLEVLIVNDCPELISVVSRKSDASFTAAGRFLPSLKMMLLLFLPKLETISREFDIAPALKMIGFYDCPELKYLCKKELSSKDLKVIKGEREWWEALKWKESEWGNCPDYLHSIFFPIDEDDHLMTEMEEIYKSIEGIPYPGFEHLWTSRTFKADRHGLS